MSKNTRPFVVTANSLTQLKNTKKNKCNGCRIEFRVGDSVTSNSTGKKRYHYLCAITLNIV